MTNRLFIFAGYDRDNIVDATLIYYLKSLSELGDIVFTMDNDLSDSELHKISQIPNVLHASAMRHGEYDFGSYKRGYIWARDKKILDKYAWVYLVNDSVLGPLFNLENTLKNLEASGADLTGMASCRQKHVPLHIQSWFVGLSQKIITSKLFDEFISGVTHQEEKMRIVFKYEVKMSQMFINRGYTIKTVFGPIDGDYIYENLYGVIQNNVPFIKKYGLKNLCITDLLWSYLDEDEISNIQQYAMRHGLDLGNEPIITPYKKLYQFSLLGIPLFSIRHRYCHGYHQYKGFLFDRFPCFKTLRHATDLEK